MRQKEKKIDIQILEEWKDSIGKDMIAKMAQEDKKVKSQLMSVISQAKRELAIIIHRLRSDFENMIRQNEDKCMASIDDLETDLCQRVENIAKGNSVDPSTKDNQSTMDSSLSTKFFRDVDWNPIEVDPHSAEFRKFIVDLDNQIQYNSGWQWNQLFTKTIIPHGSIISLEFRIIKSAYNAIAIGISDRSNITQKTSLSLKNSIAYWGDRQIWQGKKVKEEGLGFRAGDIVTMKVNTVKGSIQWSVGGQMRAQHSSVILRDTSLHLMAYIQMYDKGDRLEMLSFKLHDKQIHEEK